MHGYYYTIYSIYYKNAMKTQVQTTSVCWGIFHPLELKKKKK